MTVNGFLSASHAPVSARDKTRPAKETPMKRLILYCLLMLACLIHNVPLRSIREAKAEIKVGNGHIEVRTDDDTISLVRFSQATVAEANTVND